MRPRKVKGGPVVQSKGPDSTNWGNIQTNKEEDLESTDEEEISEEGEEELAEPYREQDQQQQQLSRKGEKNRVVVAGDDVSNGLDKEEQTTTKEVEEQPPEDSVEDSKEVKDDEEPAPLSRSLARAHTSNKNGRYKLSHTFDSENLRPELIAKIKTWLISFHQLDPRYKILKFFNQVASEGADNMMDDSIDDEFSSASLHSWEGGSHRLGRGSMSLRSLDCNDDVILEEPPVSPEKVFAKKYGNVFDFTSILSVWRPCSNDAMKKMMEGTGVGKGLDIKGKSAKTGMLSAFVPFMQIHENNHKALIADIDDTSRMRIYFHSQEARQAVIDALLPYVDTANGVEYTIPDTIDLLDSFVHKGMYGIELSQRLFWTGYVVPQDITRDAETSTGRASLPGFQDANMKTLKGACKSKPHPNPKPVVMQYDRENPIRPQTLVMAYEENGSVTPVVSDFDGFLLGWRREALWFGCNLPREQEDLMMWCIDNIEDVLDAQSENAESWTVQWLDILKNEASTGFIPEIPEYGFGDPKSYGIMERAANRLIDTGAVRHGSECFNYYFPQEMDDYFLVVSDTFSPVPWKFVDVTELQDMLISKIKEGFVFPLNPKWILCDPGWKRVYDELMKSEALYADSSKDVWFPPQIGIREKIEEICERHPNGFGQDDLIGPGSLDKASRKRRSERNNVAELAALELDSFSNNKGLLSTLRDKIKRRRAKRKAKRMADSDQGDHQVVGLQSTVALLEADKARLKLEREGLRKEKEDLEQQKLRLSAMNSNQMRTIKELEAALTPDESEVALRIAKREEELERGTALLANLYYTRTNRGILVRRGSRMNHLTGEELPDPDEKDANEQYDMLQDAIERKQSKWWKSLDGIFSYSHYIEPIADARIELESDDTNQES